MGIASNRLMNFKHFRYGLVAGPRVVFVELSNARLARVTEQPSWLMRRLYQLAAGILLGPVSLVAQRQALNTPAPVGPTTPAQELWADKVLQSLTLEEKIGQMIEVRGIMRFYSTDDPEFRKLVDEIAKYHLGAVHLTVDLKGVLYYLRGMQTGCPICGLTVIGTVFLPRQNTPHLFPGLSGQEKQYLPSLHPDPAETCDALL